MTIGNVLSSCIFRKYASGAGRASRGEFFVYLAFYILFSTLWSLGIVGLIRYWGDINLLDFVLSYVPFIFLPPLLAVSVRRLHDSDRSGWLALLLFVPLVNLFCLALLFLPGTPGSNRYGPQAAAVRLF
ncbi:DUF805 domain-containing protein [uncultured Desulfovibrio sp.]|uniref:DUF805 domain-containing protein n=1 Tax=uncultured Desulfovibrio sp. TaxID=167968 RepID=UPI002806069E|nr:DUF805 domain-containing protein [uncultured Desulfovibrio sp.]